MKKTSIFLLLYIITVIEAFSATINDSQIIHPESQIYDDFLELQTTQEILVFTNNTPICVGELKAYLRQFDYETMNDYSRSLYQRIYDYLYDQENLTTIPDFELSFHPRVNLEFYNKTNKDIPWSFNYYYKDNFITLPLNVGFDNVISFGTDIFLGKNKIVAAMPDNFFNVPINIKDITDDNYLEFYFPTFCYGSVGKNFGNWGYCLNIGRQGKSIGQTLTGSIIYNKTFETDAYFEFDIYGSAVKYSLDIVQIGSNRMDNIQKENTDRYMYYHQMDIRPFKNFKVSIIEGSLVANSFALRFLNPLVFMHQFGGWTNYISEENKEIYRETNFCADFAFMFEYVPVQNLRLYGFYNQIEMQLTWERENFWGRYYPNSIGLQFGVQYSLPLADFSRFMFGMECFYNSPYMYMKQTPSSSLYRVRQDMQTKEQVYSWIGSPYGPDCMGGAVSIEYNSNKKWKAGLDYTFVAKGENDFSTFDQTTYDGKYYNYYPSIEYRLKSLAEDGVVDPNYNTDITYDEIYDKTKRIWITGIGEFTNQIKLKGTYCINSSVEINGQIVYKYIVNFKHEKSVDAHGAEVSVAITYKPF